MATSAHETTTTPDDGAHHGDAQAAFIDRIAAKYEAEDAKHTDAEDGITADDDEQVDEEQKDEQGGADDDDQGTEEHTEAGTSTDDPDGDAGESGTDSTDDDDTDHPAGDAPAESEEGGEAEAGDDSTEEAEEEEDPASDATKAALVARGADLKLDDVPAEYRGLVEKKLKGVDAAFTRIAQEAATFRAERAKFVAEERYRAENAELAIVESIQAALEKDPDLFEKINARFDKLDDPDQAAAFKIVVDGKRKATVDAVEQERDRVEQEWQQWRERSVHVETTAKAIAAEARLPWRIAERAVEAALLRKPESARDITDDEIRTAIREEAKEHLALVREGKRAASKELVQARTATRKTTPPATGKRPAASASPRPAATRGKPVDYNSEESRQSAMMETARRLAPGMKDS